MEFLFMGQWASTEAVLVLLSVGVFVAIFLYDGYLYLRNVLHIFGPKKDTDTPPEPESIGVMTAMPVIAEHGESDEEKVQESEEAIEQKEEPAINNDDLMEINIGGDVPQELETAVPPPEESILPPELAIETPSIQAEASAITEPTGVESPVTTTDEQPLPEEPVPIVESPQEETASDSPETPIQETPVAEEIPPTPTTEEEALPATETVSASKEESPKTNHTEMLFALTNNIRTLIARGQTLEARGLIIQGLALDKQNRELNLMLAHLYEQDHHFEKAEYIYKDLALTYPNNIEILEKLGNVLIIERRYEIALEMYKKILGLAGETEGTLYILTHLSSELGQHEVAYAYGKKYQKQWPNNPEILTIISQMEIALGKRKDAIQTLIKLKNLTPYNQEIADLIQKLVLEEELAGNFNS